MLPNNIKELRKQKKMSQSELAELAGISRTHLSEIETGKVDPGTQISLRIAQVLGKPVNKIFLPQQ